MQRSLILALGIFSVWLIAFVVFEFADQRLPSILALGITYGIAAYMILLVPCAWVLRSCNAKVCRALQSQAMDCPAIRLIWRLQARFNNFEPPSQPPAGRKLIGWELKSSWRMVRAFVFKSSYPTAPFSTLYLFGRGQDIGFQKAIDNSPRKRHHIRFWALSLARAEDTMGEASFWLNTDRPRDDARVFWVGAGTKDTGLSFTRLTFQVTHATDSDTNAERDYIIGELREKRVIEAITEYQSGQPSLRSTSTTTLPMAKSPWRI